jgi:adenosylcobinamide-GDP ribazoletransferase
VAERAAATTVARRRANPLATILDATTFLTRIPVPGHVAERGATGPAAFGIVGAAIGLVATVPLLFGGAAHPLIASVVAVGIVAAISGGLHLDGLADTFDALAAPPGAADRARTDPRAGAAGVVATVVVLGVDVAALADLAARGAVVAATALVAAAAISRGLAPAWAVIVGRQWRPTDGLGAWFSDLVSGRDAAAAGLSAGVVGLAAAWLVPGGSATAAVAFLAGTASGAAVAAGALRARRQLDGDGYGATIELTFAAILIAAAWSGG